VTIGGTLVSSGHGKPAYITEHGITVTPGDNGNFNTVTVTFVVGEIRVDDAIADKVRIDSARES
jgi:hypothetical protein